jgi:hypothetical protein
MADADWSKYKQLRGAELTPTFTLDGAEYALRKLLKRDFYAAVGLYERAAGPGDLPRQVLLKTYHTDPLRGFPLGWLGRWLARRERAAGEALAGVAGVPRQLAAWGDAGLIREFVPGCNLREYRSRAGKVPEVPFYLELKRILAEVHARGLSHNDLAKPENILVAEDGRPVLIDFQIALGPRFPWPLRWLARPLLRYMQRIDRYHLDKLHTHDRRGDFHPEEVRRVRRKGPLLWLHGVVVRRPYRAARHFVLRRWLLREEGRPAA